MTLCIGCGLKSHPLNGAAIENAENGRLEPLARLIRYQNRQRWIGVHAPHGDGHTTKLISCLHGSLYVIVVNNDYESPQYMQWTSFTISAQNRLQVLVPPKFGNSHLVMSDHAVFHYKLDAYYDRKSQFTILWNNRNYKFWWPISNPILSERDSLI